MNNDYNPRNPVKVKEKKEVLESAKKLRDAINDIIDLIEKGNFPYRGNVFKTKEELEKSEESEEPEELEESEENKFFNNIKNNSKFWF